LLQARGFQAQRAADGASALELVETFSPDVALIDLKLPDIDGFEVARRLSARCPAATLVLVSGMSTETDQIEPFHHRLGKPFDLHALLSLLGHCDDRNR
jgi:DNA-binding response OmpR family regulator